MEMTFEVKSMKFLPIAFALMSLSGCALPGVAGYKSMGSAKEPFAQSKDRDPESAYDRGEIGPNVRDLKHEIACELAKIKQTGVNAPVGDAYHGLFTNRYLITVVLTLEVDQNEDLTPNLNWTKALTPAGNIQRGRSILASGQYGGLQTHTYTETYYIDSAMLDGLVGVCDANSNELYENFGGKHPITGRNLLKGDLKLRETVLNGEKSINYQYPMLSKNGVGAVAQPVSLISITPGRTKDLNPSFGSTIEFDVTYALTGLGPSWTLTTFKGPSSSTGLVDAKRVAKDKIQITFAQSLDVVAPAPSETAQLTDAVKSLTQVIAQIIAVQANEAERRETASATPNPPVEHNRELLRNPGLSAAERQKREQYIQNLRNANAAAARVVANLPKTPAANNQGATDLSGAASANQNLQTTMTLQNLNLQIH